MITTNLILLHLLGVLIRRRRFILSYYLCYSIYSVGVAVIFNFHLITLRAGAYLLSYVSGVVLGDIHVTSVMA